MKICLNCNNEFVNAGLVKKVGSVLCKNCLSLVLIMGNIEFMNGDQKNNTFFNVYSYDKEFVNSILEKKTKNRGVMNNEELEFYKYIKMMELQ